MTETVENLLLEMLKGLRNDVKAFRAQYHDDMDELKGRMSSLETSIIAVKRDVNHGDEIDARQQVTMDKIVERIERIEQRLELVGSSPICAISGSGRSNY
jgi:septation ring formation regulator EzrA